MVKKSSLDTKVFFMYRGGGQKEFFCVYSTLSVGRGEILSVTNFFPFNHQLFDNCHNICQQIAGKFHNVAVQT